MKRLLFILLLQLFTVQHVLSGENTGDQYYIVHPNLLSRTITVGGPQADIGAFTSEAIQLAVDALAVHSGGIVKLMPGTFEIMSPIRLDDNISLIGSGPETILHKMNGVQTKFIVDADYGELKLTVDDPAGFRAGMGIQVYDKIQMKECQEKS